MKPKLVIWGAGMQAKVVADIVRQQNIYQIAGFLDDINPERCGTPFEDSSVLGGLEQLTPLLQDGVQHIIFGFGHCGQRLRLAEVVTSKGFRLATAIHPAAIIAPDIQVGPGSVIKAGAIIDPAVEIGANVMISSGVTVAHGSILEDGVRLSGGVNVAGMVRIGRGAWVGVGASINAGIHIGAGALIGLGAAVLGDVPAKHVVYGVPAKVVRQVKENEV